MKALAEAKPRCLPAASSSLIVFSENLIARGFINSLPEY
jgi:hypothetical protein